ncbi:OmpA family protein [uncultured Rhodospira sp.]|uniref:OmpA family protein n=1 Tax=uncultured Rhodospira sp. TaxID=1936189 RepID=UPI0026252224|nr:OmpA family protein [uncultured Rhodospira sp.]
MLPRAIAMVLVVGLATATGATLGPAQAADDNLIDVPEASGAEMDSDDIIRMLSPRTRGLRVHSTPEAEEPSPEEGLGQLSASFDSILFAFDSARILPQSMATLNQIGRALSSDELKTYRFGVYGHTDASGRETYNADLSQRRAEAVRSYLVENFGIAPSRLQARGFGEQRLKDPAAPNSPANRRVELVNLDS